MMVGLFSTSAAAFKQLLTVLLKTVCQQDLPFRHYMPPNDIGISKSILPQILFYYHF